MSRLPMVWQFGAVCIASGLIADLLALRWWLIARRKRADNARLRRELATADATICELVDDLDELVGLGAAAERLAPLVSPPLSVPAPSGGELHQACHCCGRLESELVVLKPSGVCLDWQPCVLAAGARGRLADA